MKKIRRVLVVDNNATIVELIAAHLEAKGFQVIKAFDGLQALDRLVEAAEPPDAIVLDLIMPRLDGQRLTRFLKQDEIYASIPIVIVTGIATEDEGKLLGFGADAYIAKGKIEDTMEHLLATFRWLEQRTDPREKRDMVLGVEKLYPREMTRELLHIKGHLDTMLAMMQEGVVEVDHDHRVLYANPAASRLLGTADHQLFGKELADFFEDGDAVRAYLAGAPCGSPARPEPIRVENGDRVFSLCFSRLVDQSNYCGAIVIVEDVTAQVRRERSLLELMEAIVRHAPAGLCLLDAGNVVLAANPAFGRIFRLGAPAAAVGTPLAELIAGTGIPADVLLACTAAGEEGAAAPRTVEFAPPGSPERLVLSVLATAIATAEGPRCLLLVEDVTAKAVMELDLRRVNDELARANRAKSTFLSMVSHELRTPLSVVRGYLSLILEGKIGPEPERVLEALRVADKRARHLQHLIEELLDLSRIESGKLSLKQEPVAVRKHALEVVEMFRDERERKRLEIRVDIPEDLPPAWADHDKIHQVFTNFLSNAVKFTGEGGVITIAGRVAGGALEFSITDTGIGIPADQLDRIFDKFYQVDSSDKRLYPGTGLGLAIVRMIVTALGGALRVSSEVGRGSTFGFTLPVAAAGARPAPGPAAPVPTHPASPAAPPPPGAPAARTRVLAVDDDADTLALIRLLLPADRWEVIEARDAFAGLHEFYFRRPDVVLVDALLPVMSGLELCRIVKTHPAFGATPVIIFSAAAQEEEIRQGYQCGADDYLVKPFAPQDLLERIRKAARA